MNRIVNMWAGLFGFWFGAGGFWKRRIFPDQLERGKGIVEKKNHILIIVRPVIVSIFLWIFLALAKDLPKAVTDFFIKMRWDKTAVAIGWFKIIGAVEALGNGVFIFYEAVDKYLNQALTPIAAIFPYNPLFKFSAISIYIFCYNQLIKRIDRRLASKSEKVLQTIPGLRDMIKDIYIIIPGSDRCKLSPKWERVKTKLGAIICLNFIIIYFLNLRLNFATNTIWEFLPVYLIPITGFFCLMEAYHYLSFADSEGRQSDEDSMFNVVKLRRDYQQYALKSGISMVCEYRRHKEFAKAVCQITTERDIEPEDSVHAFLYEYLEEKCQLGHIDMASRLIEGENIFYASPFYRDMDGCIFFPIFQALLRQKKGLILVEDNGELGEIVQWMSEGIAAVPGLKRVWNVEVLKGTVEDVDVGIMPFQRISTGQNVEGLDEFLREVAFAVVLRASDMLMGGQEVITAMAEHVHGRFPQCTWLLCDWNAESMVDLFAHLLEVDFTYVNATPAGAGEMMVSYWDVETEPDQIWVPAKRFLGLEVGIAEIAGRNRLPCTVWYGEEWMPVLDMNWIIGQYYQLYSRKTSQFINQGKMNTQIQCSISGISSVMENESFLVVEDSFCNLYEVARQYVTRARHKVYVHVLSPNYLLRDFMKARSDTMKDDPKYIAQFVPEYANSTRNVYLHLLRRLLEGEVSKREIYEALRACEDGLEYGQGSYAGFIVEGVIKDIIKVLLNVPFEMESDIQIIEQRLFSEEEEDMVREHSFHIISNNIRRAFHKYFQQACYIDEIGEKYYINHLMLAGHLELKYLPGQYVTLNGKYYQVERILDSGRETFLGVKRASEQVIERCYYRQLRKYEQRYKAEKTKLVYEENDISLTRLIMDFAAYTTGYLKIRKSWNNFEDAQESEYMHFGREYFRKRVLRIKLPIEEIRRDGLFYLAAVIHDMFYTLYPQYCYLLSVAVCWEKDEEDMRKRYRGILSEFTDVAQSNDENAREKYVYIFEDSREDMGLLQSIERHFGRILRIASDYIKWAVDKPPYFPE